ncbi:hypothetical protein PUMCH_000086 [Australozyma saopauloensis]|uniref:Uncharacterized protein n=1 Tax=Australozyma saopauloensis TaxID=291208 RepID=A0AAX4H3W1_9ASCO|nr:hypothetical protein PUMCH_000086 [[Candida] saopauloensis]
MAIEGICSTKAPSMRGEQLKAIPVGCYLRAHPTESPMQMYFTVCTNLLNDLGVLSLDLIVRLQLKSPGLLTWSSLVVFLDVHAMVWVVSHVKPWHESHEKERVLRVSIGNILHLVIQLGLVLVVWQLLLRQQFLDLISVLLDFSGVLGPAQETLGRSNICKTETTKETNQGGTSQKSGRELGRLLEGACDWVQFLPSHHGKWDSSGSSGPDSNVGRSHVGDDSAVVWVDIYELIVAVRRLAPHGFV